MELMGMLQITFVRIELGKETGKWGGRRWEKGEGGFNLLCLVISMTETNLVRIEDWRAAHLHTGWTRAPVGRLKKHLESDVSCCLQGRKGSDCMRSLNFWAPGNDWWQLRKRDKSKDRRRLNFHFLRESSVCVSTELSQTLVKPTRTY